MTQDVAEGRTYSEAFVGELRRAFERVEPRDNWKLPIDATVDLNDAELALVRHAVTFFTGSVATFTPKAGARLPRCRYRVQAIGYYAAVGS